MEENIHVHFDFNPDDAQRTQITGAYCTRCDWTLAYPPGPYGEPHVARFKREAYDHVCKPRKRS